MSNENLANDEFVSRARDMLAEMENGNTEQAGKLLDELTQLRESSLFQEVGKLTRELHEALNSFRGDADLSHLAEHDIPDARERLHYVITMTDQAANSSMGAVEAAMPLCESIAENSASLRESWERFTGREMDAEEFRALSKQIADFLNGTSGDIEAVRGNLNEILMAQGFQDLTGQIIRKVINLVEHVENDLVNLIRISGAAATQGDGKAKQDDPEDLQGPPVPGMEADTTVSGQDEVDELLSSLGF